MKNALLFLAALKKHNNRDWFEQHKEEYLAARETFIQLSGKVKREICRFDKAIDPSLDPSESVFRIYRDVRFSKDKTPYKTHFAASINPGGRKSITAGYYLHVQPGNSFVAGGVWKPPADMLQAIRQEIDYEANSLQKIIKSSSFKKYFSGFDEEGRMQTAPKGYSREHPQIELLRNRNFIVSHQFQDKEVLSPAFAAKAAAAFKAMYPLMEFLRKAQDTE